MRQTAAASALLFAIVGLTVSATAAYVHYRMLADPTYTSFCDVSATGQLHARSIAAASAPSTVFRSRSSAASGSPLPRCCPSPG